MTEVFVQTRTVDVNMLHVRSGIQSSSGAASGTVNCPICHELVSGKRFAPHLERCMNGGKRGSKRNYDYLHDEPAPARPAAKVKPVETDQDPLRNSLIVRLKLKNGGKHLPLCITFSMIFVHVVCGSNTVFLSCFLHCLLRSRSAQSKPQANRGDNGGVFIRHRWSGTYNSTSGGSYHSTRTNGILVHI